MKTVLVRTPTNDRYPLKLLEEADLTPGVAGPPGPPGAAGAAGAAGIGAADYVMEAGATLTANNSVLLSWVPTDKATEEFELTVLAHEEPTLNASVFRFLVGAVARFNAVPNTTYLVAYTSVASGGMNLGTANVTIILVGGGDPTVQVQVTGDGVHPVTWRAILKRYIL